MWKRSSLLGVCFLWALFSTSTVFAVQYDVPILVETEQDISDLYANGDITEDERDRLIALLNNPLNINEADRLSLVELPGVTYAMADAILRLRDQKGGFKTLGLIEQFCSLVLPHLYSTTVLPKHKYGFPVGIFCV